MLTTLKVRNCYIAPGISLRQHDFSVHLTFHPELGKIYEHFLIDQANEVSPKSMVPTAVIDFRKGEAIATYHILAELSKHRETPISVFGSRIEGRPTINVTLKASIADEDAGQEYRAGRFITIRDKRNHETEHFSFEWIAPQ